ncbi:MAG: NADH-quinone oxidoreductase subunit N [Verrucomicrobiota bacterium]
MSELLSEFLHGYTETNDWSAIMPEIMMAILALALLVAEMALPRSQRQLIPRIAIWGQVAVLIAAWVFYFNKGNLEGHYFNRLIEQDTLTHVMRGFFLLSSILVCYLGQIYLSKHALPRTEFYHLIIIVSAAMMLLVQSANFVMLFVALETVTIAFYVLVAYCRSSALSLEAGLKYLILGALSSSILLFGIVLLYGAAGNPDLLGATTDALQYDELATFITFNSTNLLVVVGALLVIAGICFKIGAVPFQIWVPDVYQGAPTPITAYLAVASKAAGFIVLLLLVTGPFQSLGNYLVPVLGFIASATILFGNFAAVTQGNLKRLMGLSGVAHAGYMLVGIIAAIRGVEWAGYAVVFYLFTYLLASFAVFGVMALVAKKDAGQELKDYDQFAQSHPYLSAVLTFGLGSLAGIPPLGGFIGKLFLFVAAYQAGLYGLLGVSIIGVVISIYYYFGWIRECYFSNRSSEPIAKSGHAETFSDKFVLGALVVAMVVLGLFPAALPIIP